MSFVENYFLIKEQQNLEDLISSYESSIKALEFLPQKLEHSAQIPLNSVCSFPGKITHTNNVFVKTDSYLLERTAYDASRLLTKKKNCKPLLEHLTV